VNDALRAETGDVLVFLPGTGEIRRVEAILADRDIGGAVVAPLHGSLGQGEQDNAILPDPRGRRKIVLATSIAETSLTIEGIRVVIDCGLSRRPRFSPASGMTRLETVRVSRASADQRRGRAGRVGPGVCYRLWAEHETQGLLADTPPEITSADLAPLALDLASAGVRDPAELAWLNAPNPAAFAQAQELLVELEALTPLGEVTAHGRAMATLPAHPRLANMLVHARAADSVEEAARIAALLGERDIFRSTGAPIDADITLRLDVLRRDSDAGAPAGAGLDYAALHRARDEARRLTTTKRSASTGERLSPGALLALAYPDRVAQRRAGERARFVLRNGRGAELLGPQSLANAAYIVAAELDDRRPESRVFLAGAIELAEIRAMFAGQITTRDVVEFDDAADAVVAHRREQLGAIVLRETDSSNPDPEAIRAALLDAIRRRGIASIPWSDAARRMRERMTFVARHDELWPEVSDDALEARIEEWLAPLLGGVRRLRDLERLDLAEALRGLAGWKHAPALDKLAPTHIEVPTGSRIPVDYSDPDAPVLAVRIQEVFGLTESPHVLGGRIPITMHLLSPAHRPVQVTRDLAGFWRTSYFDVRKDLRGRYPKHEWPEDPLTATPTRRAKPRK
jgi:ATP-dependent helicase HrpB